MEVKQGSGDDTSSEGSKSTEPAGAGSETDRSYGYGDPSDEAVQETTTDYRLLPLLPELEHRLLRAPVSDNDIVVIKVGSRKEECDIVLNMPALRVHDVHFEVIREQSSVDILVHADLYLDGTLIRGPHSRHNLLNTMAIGVPVKDDDLGFCNVFIAYLGKPPLPDHGRSEIDRAFYTSKELGSGAYGVVLLAHEKESFQARALKFVKRKLLSKDPEKESLAAFARFDESLKVTTIEKEEKILQRLSHSNIISNFKYPCEGDPILSMEYMTGGTLQERIDAFPSGIEPHYLKVYFYQVFEAVKYLHSQKIAHCDIKPANILMKSNARSTTVKLSDFGLCRILSEEDMDAEERLRSTAGFLPPHTELIAVKFMKQIDLFALLISLCQCASSSPKFTCVGTPFYQTGNDYFDAIKSTISTLDMDQLTLQLALFILNAYYVEKKDVAHVLTQSDWFQDNAIKEEVYKLCI